jgi:hypothetical protein
MTASADNENVGLLTPGSVHDRLGRVTPRRLQFGSDAMSACPLSGTLKHLFRFGFQLFAEIALHTGEPP